MTGTAKLGTVMKHGGVQTVPLKGKTVVRPQFAATAALITALLSPMSAFASSDEAWAELREDLVSTCEKLAQDAMPDAQLDIMPNEYGSESYAVAIVKAGEDLSVCVYDKRTRTAELTTPFHPTPE